MLKGEKKRKGIAGKGQLNDRVINTLQNYYGIKKVIASIHHCSENDNMGERHKFSPSNEKTWCIYQRDEFTAESTYKSSINIPKNIFDLISPIFLHSDLGRDSLLERCLDGQTQNCSEALNQLIWKRCPKDIFVGKIIIEIGVSSAILSFNEGNAGS